MRFGTGLLSLFLSALAAGAQNKGWNFIETWYRNQGEENSGYATSDPGEINRSTTVVISSGERTT